MMYDVSGHSDVASVIEVIDSVAADLVGLVGMPSGRPLRTLLRATDLDVAVRGTSRGAATLVLAKHSVPLRTSDRIPLATSRASTSRTAAYAIVAVDGVNVAFAAVDFGLRAEVRLRNAELVIGQLGNIEPPLIIVGACHEPPGGPVVAAVTERLVDAFAVAGSGSGDTYPASDPVARHDYVFVDPRLSVERCVTWAQAPVETAARHRPVVADLSPSADIGLAQRAMPA